MLFYQRFSGDEGRDRPLLIVLHGLFGSSDNWRKWAVRLSSSFDVVLPDLRNHGRSPLFREMDYRSMAQDIVEISESLRKSDRKVHILGHSMGGKAAMAAALLRPDLFGSLVVGDIGPKRYPPIHRDVIDGLKALWEESPGSRSEGDEILSSYVSDHALRSFLLKNLRKREGRYALPPGFKSIIDGYDHILEWPLSPDNAAFEGPVLFIKGEKSSYLTDRDRPVIREFFPRASLVSIENAGHWLHVENPRQFDMELNRFYAEYIPLDIL